MYSKNLCIVGTAAQYDPRDEVLVDRMPLSRGSLKEPTTVGETVMFDP